MPEIKERPILFSAPMVRAILEGRKTVTRRAMKCQPDADASITVESYNVAVTNRRGYQEAGPAIFGAWWRDGESGCKSPYGKPGDRLWVRETFALLGNEDGCCIDWQDNLVKGDERGAARIYRASCPPGDYGLNQIPAKAEWKPDTEAMEYDGAWRPSIHMPRWASRILLEITDVRVERLQGISEEQANAEGVRLYTDHAELGDWWHVDGIETYSADPRKSFELLWSSVGGNWSANPWVWVVEFKRMKPVSQ
ncbi:morphogenetic protein [Pseudomonas sp. W2Aug9]|uniref:morphogenetic protein n=1 Tax=Pseudomonas sp. W2Aug9 TaxID=1215242 RepID=UPI0020058880|nr:morphogenetic protein [Pseudomonas sp. W2Aug9]MCK3826207.1 morphogenetic protein [Pseudomonas sp. W2Aug9]